MSKYHKGIRVDGSDEFLFAVNITGSGAPTEDTEADPGMIYMDTDSDDGDLYKCIKKEEIDGKTRYIWKFLDYYTKAEIDAKLSALDDALAEAVGVLDSGEVQA